MSEYRRDKDDTFDGDRFAHLSYGQISISRVNSSGAKNLYGSNIKHGNFISLEINESEHVRHLHRDTYFSNKSIIKIEMSSAQFAELITTLNYGCGTPCTIRWTREHGCIEECPQYSAKQEFDNEFKDDMKSLSLIVDESLEALNLLASQKSIKKSEVKAVLGKITHLKQQLNSNIPFVADQFTKHVDKTVSTAKAEIDSMLTHVITQAGLEHLKKEDVLEIPNE